MFLLAVAAPAARPDKRLSLRLFHLSNFPGNLSSLFLRIIEPASFLSSAPFHPPMPIPLLLKDPLNVFPSSSSRPHFRFRFLVRLSKTTAASSWNSSFILLSLAKSIGNALEGQGTFERSLRRKLILLIPPFEQTGVDEELKSRVWCVCVLINGTAPREIRPRPYFADMAFSSATSFAVRCPSRPSNRRRVDGRRAKSNTPFANTTFDFGLGQHY